MTSEHAANEALAAQTVQRIAALLAIDAERARWALVLNPSALRRN